MAEVVELTTVPDLWYSKSKTPYDKVELTRAKQAPWIGPDGDANG